MRRLLLPILVLVLWGCSTTTMHIDPVLTSLATPMNVSDSHFLGRKWVTFGPYKADASSGIPWAASADILGTDVDVAWQRHRLVVKDGPQSVESDCRTRQLSLESGGLRLVMKPLLECVVKPQDGEPWTLSLRAASPTDSLHFEGVLERRDGSERIVFASEHRVNGVEQLLTKPFGYTVTRDGAPVAAIETRMGKRVWIAGTLQPDERLRAATLAAALLLFGPEERDRLRFR